MKKASDRQDLIVGHVIDVSLNQLRMVLARFETAIKERAEPGQVVMVELAHGVWLYNNPAITRSDLERSLRKKLGEVDSDRVPVPLSSKECLAVQPEAVS